MPTSWPDRRGYSHTKLYDTLRYTAFGEQLTKAYYSPWRFAGKRYDDESKLIYFGRRYYSPSLGRWITADPQGFDDGPNLYAYVRNSPLLAIDLYGLEGRNGAWANYRGSWRATWDYCYDGFCHVGPWIGSRMKTGYEMQWSLISNPMGHVRRLWNDVYDFAKQAPQEMNVTSFKRGCAEAGKSLFPKSTQAMHSLSDNTLDDYTRAYRNQQASLEVVSYCAMFLAGALEFSTFGKASRLAEEVVSAEEFLAPKGGMLNGNSIWSATKQRTPVKNAYYHWKKHGIEFPNLQNANQYVEHAHNLFKDPKVLSRMRSDGVLLLYDVETNTFGSFTAEGVPKTVFKPSPSRHPYATNLEYFYGQ